MKKMGTLFIALMGLAIAAAFALVVVNRASSEVVNAAVPVAFAALSALGLVFAFARQPTIERIFPVVFVVQQADKYPVVVPDRRFPSGTLALFDQAVQSNPRALDDPRFADFGGGPLFHEFLQKSLVDWISMRHFGTWRMRVDRFSYGSGGQEQFGPTPDAGQYSSKVLSKEELTAVLGSNIFAGVHSGFGKIALPPRTMLSVSAPPEGKQEGEIRLKNWFVDMRIYTRQSFSMVGLGNYTMLMGMPQEEAQQHFWTLQYVVRIEANFNRYLVGHPHMEAHRDWANGIVAGLAHDFDEEAIWRTTTESYMLRQHLTGPLRNATIGLGPIRSAAPAK